MPDRSRMSLRVLFARIGYSIFLLLLLPTIGPAGAQQASPTADTTPVVAESVQLRDVVIDHTFVGTVTPTRTSLVGSTVEGRVVKLLVEDGAIVTQGQTLAQVRQTGLEIELSGAQAELLLLQQQLEDLVVSQPQEIKQAEARMRAAEALHEYASQELQRGRNLVRTSAITPDQLDQMVSAADSARNVLSERTSAYELAVAVAPLKKSQAESRVKVQQEIVHGLEDSIAEHTIVAPFDGFVTREHTEIGQWIAKGGPVVEIIELNEIEVEIPVLETYVSELLQRTEGQPGTKTLHISVDAVPGDPIEGEIVSIIPKANAQSHTFPVKVRLTNRRNPDGQFLLKPGMFARVTLPVRTIKNALMIPKDALVLGHQSAMVWVVEPAANRTAGGGDRLRAVTVEVAYEVSDGTSVQVVGPRSADGSLPLQPGAMVVTEGNERINPAMGVTVTHKESAS
ncbi:MAG: efflux RND transporter periplasmic adaptor subunit [Pirellulaceae bacterium]